jgi:hypothetical protein
MFERINRVAVRVFLSMMLIISSLMYLGWRTILLVVAIALLVRLGVAWLLRQEFIYKDRPVLWQWLQRVETALQFGFVFLGYGLSFMKSLFVIVLRIYRRQPWQRQVVLGVVAGIISILLIVWLLNRQPLIQQMPQIMPSAYAIGVDRATMTEEQIAVRMQKLVESRTFWILRQEGAVPGADRVTQPGFRNAVESGAAQFGIDPNILEAHLYLESFGVTTAKSPTGPKGPGQFAALTAANMCVVKDGRYLLRYRGIEKNCARGKRRTRSLSAGEIIEDNREDVELSAYAAAKLLREELDFFGRQDFASFAYHTGRDRVRRWVLTYLAPQPTTVGGKQDIEMYGLSLAKLYFGSTPYFNPGTYQMFRELMRIDYGPTYYARIECAKNILALYRSNHGGFIKLVEKQQYRGRRAANRMWTFYGPDDEQFVTLDDLKAALANGEVVPVPNDSKFGFELMLNGANPIGQKDLANQQYYVATKPETAGALLFIANQLQRLRGQRDPLIFQVSSITRTVDYQGKLRETNKVATKAVSFHVLGLAFDITKRGLSADDLRDIQFILDELDSTGMIAWVPENDAFHIVVAPDPEVIKFFQTVYTATGSYRLALP